ncbi:MAG: phosphopyruvate hydratase [Candidatus Pacebacteria bacterium]|nr:phosphopyruvate hydratase [Candidatus Paceibacterota bacterium]
MPTIAAVQAREILDARGIPTLETTLWLDNGHSVVTSVPGGTSIGKYEAKELRDQDPNRLLGKGTLQAVANVNQTIAPQLKGKDPTHQTELDQLMVDLDGTPNKAKLGANAILSVSQAILKAGALSAGLPLYQYLQQKYQLTNSLVIPTCIYGIINGGEHGADNLDLQEFQIIPASNLDFPTSLTMAATLQHQLEEVLISKGAIHSFGLLGGFTPNLYNNTDVFEILVETIKTTAYTFAQDVFFGVDAAASEFAENGKYELKDKSQPYSAQELLEYYQNMRNTYKLIYLEDPFKEDDQESWQTITNELGQTTKIVGDSLLATNKEKTLQAIKNNTCNSILIKPNQTGTISEAVEVVKIAKDAGWTVVISHRSGETTDSLIADFAVGVGAEMAKFGPVSRGERVIKYNRLAQIHQEITNNTSSTPSSSLANASNTASTAAATSNQAANHSQSNNNNNTQPSTNQQSGSNNQPTANPQSATARNQPATAVNQ